MEHLGSEGTGVTQCKGLPASSGQAKLTSRELGGGNKERGALGPLWGAELAGPAQPS